MSQHQFTASPSERVRAAVAAVRQGRGRSLLMGFGAGLILFLLLLTAGFLFYESADLRNGGLGLLLSCGCGGALAGVLGGQPKKKRRR